MKNKKTEQKQFLVNMFFNTVTEIKVLYRNLVQLF